MIKVVINRKGVRNLLRSDAIKGNLAERANRIAAAAGEGFVADSSVGRNRAHASVVTATFDAQKAEAEDQVLTRAIDAGR